MLAPGILTRLKAVASSKAAGTRRRREKVWELFVVRATKKSREGWGEREGAESEDPTYSLQQ